MIILSEVLPISEHAERMSARIINAEIFGRVISERISFGIFSSSIIA